MGEQFSNENRWIKVRGISGLVYAINLDKVVYIRDTKRDEERDGARAMIKLEDGKIYTRETFSEIGEKIK